MSDKELVPWAPLTPEQWNSVPNADHTALFSRDEVFAALQQFVPADEAAAIADDLYGADRKPGVFFFGELLTALSTLSESAAARVRAVVHDPRKGVTQQRKPSASTLLPLPIAAVPVIAAGLAVQGIHTLIGPDVLNNHDQRGGAMQPRAGTRHVP